MSATACPNRRVLQYLRDARLSADDEAGVAAHLGQCVACRTALESLAAGDHSAEIWAQKFREDRVEIGPAMREVLTSLGTPNGLHKQPREVEKAVSRGGGEAEKAVKQDDPPSPGGSAAAPLPQAGEGRQENAPPAYPPRPSSMVPGEGRQEKADEKLPFLDPPDSPDCIGRLGRYRVLKLLGRGGMGVVFQARDPLLGRLVAIKVLTPQLDDDKTARDRFLREARAAAAINHPNVVTIYAVEEVGSLLLLVMEFVDGVSLHDRLRQRTPFSLSDIARIGAQTAAGLAAAHTRGLVHRDIKPANILLARPTDQVKIADFGLARTSDDTAVTNSGLIVGTPAYMAPEQASGHAVDHRADLFSFGSVLYALCTGRPPYSGSTALAVVRQVADGEPSPLSAVAPSSPAWLADVVSKLHARNPADRFQSAAEVALLFRRQWKALQGTGPAELPPEKGSAAIADGPTPVSPSPAVAAPSMVIPPPVSIRDVAVPLPPPPTMLRSQTLPTPLPPPVPPPRPQFQPMPMLHRPPKRAGTKRYGVLAALVTVLLLVPIAIYGIKQSGELPEHETPQGDARENHGVEPTGAAAATAVDRPMRFAIIAQDGTTRRTFSDWNAAIEGAASGDTLEIRGSDPIRIAPMQLHDKALVIRAAEGARPTLSVARVAELIEVPWIRSDAALAIEGLDIQCGPAEANAFLPPSVLSVRRAPLRLANCRVLHRGAGPAIRLEDTTACEVRNSLLHCSQGAAIDCVAGGPLRVLVENCILSGFSGFTLHQTGQATEAALELRHDTLVLHEAIRVHLDLAVHQPAKADGRAVLHIATSRNLFDTDGSLLTSQADRQSAAEAERIGRVSRGESGKKAEPRWGKTLTARMNASMANVKKSVVWRSEQDLYSGAGPFLALVSSQSPKQLNAIGEPGTLAQWNTYWGMSPAGIAQLAEGSFDGQSLRGKAAAAPESLWAADNRRAFPSQAAWHPLESRLEGANTALVGPGDPYAAWQNTIDYRTWVESLRPKQPAK